MMVNNMIDIDSIDQKLIAILRSNSRMPVVSLAKQLGVSRATVQNRMSRLEKNGVIINYTVNLKPGVELNPIRAFMSIAVEGKKGSIVVKVLRGYPSIVALHNTNGRWDIIAEIHTDTLESFNTLLGDIRLIDGVSSTETSLLLDTLRL